MSSLTCFKKLVHQRCGLHLEGFAEARLVRALNHLHKTTGIHSEAMLIARLEQDSTLFERFISQLTVNETYFFREPEALNWLVNTYLPRQLDTHTPLRLLSAGCSSGEEPYSLAMALMERYGEHAKQLFQITGGDVDQQVLNKAQTGIYSGMAFRTLHPALKARYFTPLARNTYRVKETLREWVTFHPFNLLAPDAPSLDGPFDVIFFRNVSIYFDETTRLAIQKHLKQRLAPNGIMVCGVTETLGNDLGVFALEEDQGIFYFKASSEASLPAMALAPALTPKDGETAENDTPAIAPLRAAELTAPASELSAPSSKPAPLFNEALKQAHELLNQNKFSDASQQLTRLLDEAPWSVDTLLLAGLAARWQQQPQQAFGYFKRAIYVAPECWPAHFYQAELLRQGELPDNPLQRQRGYAAVVRLLEASPHASGALKVIHSPLPPGDAHFLAKCYLEGQAEIQGEG